MEALYRPTWANINLEAIGYNINQIRKRIPARTGIMAVVKADGYGHGAVEVARKALASGAEWLGAALLEEALTLRNAGIKAPILVFGWVAPEHVHIAAQEQITLTFFQREWLEAVNKLELNQSLQVHMKWDTGMGRVGIRTEEELEGMVQMLRQSRHVSLTGIYTHFATADERDAYLFNEQHARFQTLKSMFENMWAHPVSYHTGNSAAASRYPDYMYDYIRFGIAMYGLYPSAVTKMEHPIDLKPALSLHTRLIHVKEISRGATISYGATYQADGAEWIGTIPIGYADGWIRQLQGIEVLVDGKRMPVVGRICMDQSMIKLDQPYPLGTHVTLIGRQGEDEVTADEIAEKLETINYEVTCMISGRVPRLYESNDLYLSR